MFDLDHITMCLRRRILMHEDVGGVEVEVELQEGRGLVKEEHRGGGGRSLLSRRLLDGLCRYEG